MARVKHERVRYMVSGAGRFPIDMLRYDQCWPAAEEESAELVKTGPRCVVLVGVREPTPERWKSFGWYAGKCVGVRP